MTRAAFEIYQDRKKQFRWRLLAGSEIHRVIIADSGESYTRRRDARRAATRVKTLAKNAIVA